MGENRPLSDTSQARRTLSLARNLLNKGGALESTNSGETIDRTRLAQELERRIQMSVAFSSLPSSVTAKAVTAETLTNTESALNKTAGGASPSTLTDMELASLEAIIQVTGRPATRYSNGRVQMPSGNLGENDHWRVLVATTRLFIDRASASVGRITITGNEGLEEHIGTGWCAEGNLIITNRHVVYDLVSNPDASLPSWKINKAKRPFIDFAATDNATASQRFEIAEVAYCAKEEYVDIAAIRVSSGAGALPRSLAVNWDKSALGRERAGAGAEPSQFQGSDIYVIGHPYRRHSSEPVATVFGVADGYKRWSPGVVVQMDDEKTVLEHDCSTLGGNSGSCVLTAESHDVIGIHIGGLEVDKMTGRGSANIALAFSYLGSHEAANILKTGRVEGGR
ncbi:MAG TPA: serine protease [Blastocatellia bacterium]|nr:serine protease [Blastocatellia bacterium]